MNWTFVPGEARRSAKERPGKVPHGYRFGFNGKANDDEVYGVTGSFQDYGMRDYDTRAARFIKVDPIAKDYAYLTPYQFASLNPILNVDLDGLEGYTHEGLWTDKHAGRSAIPISRGTYEGVISGNIEADPDYIYVYTPYKDPLHPEVRGMSPDGDNGYKGFWYKQRKNAPDTEPTLRGGVPGDNPFHREGPGERPEGFTQYWPYALDNDQIGTYSDECRCPVDTRTGEPFIFEDNDMNNNIIDRKGNIIYEAPEGGMSRRGMENKEEQGGTDDSPNE